MAWGVFTFNNEGRLLMASVLRALLICQLVVSVCMVIFCYNTSEKVMFLLKDIHKVTVLLLYCLILFQAYCMKVHYTSGLRLITWVVRCPHWERTSRLTTTWLVAGTLVSLNSLLVYAACNSTMKALMKEMSLSMRVGISQYLTEPGWKHLLDTMQIELSCCGAEGPADWHEIPWINMDFLNEDSELVMKVAGTDGKLIPPVSPYSCCTPRVLAACYHDPLQQLEMSTGGVESTASAASAASVQARGCVEAARGALAAALLALHCFNMLLILFQCLIVVLTRWLSSSARSAALHGDGAGPGRGCLWGRLDPLHPRPCATVTGRAGRGAVAALRVRPTRARVARRARPA